MNKVPFHRGDLQGGTLGPPRPPTTHHKLQRDVKGGHSLPRCSWRSTVYAVFEDASPQTARRQRAHAVTTQRIIHSRVCARYPCVELCVSVYLVKNCEVMASAWGVP